MWNYGRKRRTAFNGLSVEHNALLLATSDLDVLVALILRGLRTLLVGRLD